jgi:hypothetical protein
VEVYHQLLLEGHLLLESRLAALLSSIALSSVREPIDTAAQLSFQLEAENYRKLLRKSASLLADVRRPPPAHVGSVMRVRGSHPWYPPPSVLRSLRRMGAGVRSVRPVGPAHRARLGRGPGRGGRREAAGDLL